ncbi:molybdopterin molybdotransferase MoeA [Urechidicola croceus]|uniref:molybdopterin molybdotransferase MoeA n=1 Tax=Urechidicola croceus TaxID=1850246 RepID=UPI000A7D2825|nr:molybdopterin molybdotransferase MoeA [Urechidicola croceus]
MNQSEDFGVEQVNFIDSLGRVLKEDIIADRDFPPFNRVSMDGVAVSFQEFEKGIRIFEIEGVQAAGSAQLTLKNSSNCIEIMTGATLPKNADVVIPYEQVKIENGFAKVTIEETLYFKNIHRKGKDQKEGDIIIHKNTLISPAEIGVITTVGKSKVTVAKHPKVMIISTGDELVEVNETPKEYQIRRSNVHTLVSLLKQLQIPSETTHIKDDKDALKSKIEQYLIDYDVLLFSGAVSKGKFDFIPEVLDELGVDKLFHRVAQRPGKPFWYGKKDDKSIFAFPGNPISTFVNCIKYFYPWFQKSVGLESDNKEFAVLAEDITFKPQMTYFLQVKLENKNGTLLAIPVHGNGSGDLANLVKVDAFLELPADKTEFKKGDIFPILRYRSF